MKLALATLIGAALGAAGYAAFTAGSAQGQNAMDTRVFELRTYHVLPGRMNAMNARFRNHTTKLFEKHGMVNIGYWQPIDPKEAEVKLIYIVAHKSREAAEASWKAFRADPEWIKVRTESERDGKIVEKVESVFLKPTDYSAVK